MGIYSDGNIYGVYWFIHDESGAVVKEYDKKYKKKMGREEIAEISEEYNKLSEDTKQSIRVKFYTKYTSTYEIGLSDQGDSEISLWPGSRAMLEDLLANGDIRI